MPRLIPEEPTFVTASEREVWNHLRDTLPPDAVLLANVRITDEHQDYEADLVVLQPGTAALVVEVKGGSVWHADGQWWIRRGSEEHKIDPVTQVRDTKYAVRDYVQGHPTWGSRSRISWAHAVVTPHTDHAPDFTLPDAPRWLVHGRSEIPALAAGLWHTASQQVHNLPVLDEDSVLAVADALTSRPLGSTYDVNAEALERATQADRLTQEQAMILRVTRLLHRVEVRGGAGSGKTVLALQQAKELTRGRKQRVALVCYSIGLAEHLKRQVASWPRNHRPSFVGTFHELGQLWGAPDGERTDSDFWEQRLPALMADLAAELPDGKRYDAVVVDEAQDFADSWWTAVLRSLRDEEQGGLYVYSDENQRLFARFGRPPVQLVPLVLDHNLRNTKQIHAAFGPLAPSRMRALGGDGPDVRFVASPTADALSAADDVVDEMLDAGWEPGRLALLTTGHRHPIQVELAGFHDQTGYWATYFEGEDVFYGHVLGCKGLERPVVVLCVNEDGQRDRARERLYVGMSRATDQLVVVGDPDVITRVGGPDVARRLGIG